MFISVPEGSLHLMIFGDCQFAKCHLDAELLMRTPVS